MLNLTIHLWPTIKSNNAHVWIGQGCQVLEIEWRKKNSRSSESCFKGNDSIPSASWEHREWKIIQSATKTINMLFDWDVRSCGKKKPFPSFLTWKRKMSQSNCAHISKTLWDWPHTESLWSGKKTTVKKCYVQYIYWKKYEDKSRYFPLLKLCTCNVTISHLLAARLFYQ